MVVAKLEGASPPSPGRSGSAGLDGERVPVLVSKNSHRPKTSKSHGGDSEQQPLQSRDHVTSRDLSAANVHACLHASTCESSLAHVHWHRHSFTIPVQLSQICPGRGGGHAPSNFATTIGSTKGHNLVEGS